MARPISDEELQLRKRARRRLIGAIVLVAAVAAVLPMVLDREPKPASQEVNITIPSPDAGAFASKVAPALPAAPLNLAPKPAPAAEKPDTKPAADSPRPAAETRPAPAAAVKEAAKPAEKETAKPAEKQEAAKTPVKAPPLKETAAQTAHATSGQFVVQVVALSDAAKAKQMRQQISEAGIKSYTEIVKTAKGDVTRVRAGPFATRGAAEKAQKQLTALGFNGKVVPK